MTAAKGRPRRRSHGLRLHSAPTALPPGGKRRPGRLCAALRPDWNRIPPTNARIRAERAALWGDEAGDGALNALRPGHDG